MTPFDNADAVARYAEGPPRLVPGFADLQRMAEILLAERAPADARILVLGAGGGLELKHLAETQPHWRFDGVDPAAAMLDLARATLGALATRIDLHQGYVDMAPEGPFDAATCLLTLHFVPQSERLRTLRELHRRLKPGAPLVVAHHSIPATQKERWLARSAAFAARSGIDPEKAAKGAAAVGAQLPILAPEEDEALLRDAGFAEVDLFYAAFTFRGWVGYA